MAGNAFDDIPGGTVPTAAAAAQPTPTGNAFDDITPPAAPVKAAKPGATAADRIQAAEGGILKGVAYTAGLIPDTISNAIDLGKAAVGTAVTAATGHPAPDWLDVNHAPSPTGAAISALMDKSPITTTQPTRPDDTASRYLATAGSVVPAIAAGGGGAGQIASAFTKAAVPAVAGQYVAESKPFGKDNDTANNAASILTQALGTAAMPGRATGEENPNAVVSNATVRAAQDAGLVIPPATSNPSAFNRSIEGLAGKSNVEQHAVLRNQPVTNQVARDQMQIGGSGPIAESEISQVYKDAGPAYQAVRNAGTITQDPQLKVDFGAAMSKFSGASKLSSALGKNDLQPIIDDILQKPTFDAGDALDAVGTLRDKSKAAFQAGDSGNGAAYKAAGNAIENQIQRSLSTQGAPSDVIANYQAARQRSAVAHTVEDALNSGSGNVNAQKLGKALNNGVPLQGDLLSVAKAANLAPKAFAEPTSSQATGHGFGLLGSIVAGGELSHFLPDSWGHAGLALPVGMLALKGGRAAADKYALSGAGQAGGIQMAPGQRDPAVLAAALLSANARQQQ